MTKQCLSNHTDCEVIIEQTLDSKPTNVIRNNFEPNPLDKILLNIQVCTLA